MLNQSRAKHFSGEVINGYRLTSPILSESSSAWNCECTECGKVYNYPRYYKAQCTCKGGCRNDVRFSGSTIEKTEEELSAIKEKYKNGVTAKILKEFVNSLIK